MPPRFGHLTGAVCGFDPSNTQVRFDVVRARKCKVAVEPTAPCAEYSWFPGQAWRMAACASCHTHLGWHFQPAPLGDDGQAGEGDEDEDHSGDATPTRGGESRVGSKRSRVASPPPGTSSPLTCPATQSHLRHSFQQPWGQESSLGGGWHPNHVSI